MLAPARWALLGRVVGGGPGLLVGLRVGPCLAAQGELPAAWGRPHVSLTVFSCPVAC